MCHYFVDADFGVGVGFVGREVESPTGTDSLCQSCQNLMQPAISGYTWLSLILRSTDHENVSESLALGETRSLTLKL